MHTGMRVALGRQGAPAADPRQSWHSVLATPPEYPPNFPPDAMGGLPSWLEGQNQKWSTGSTTAKAGAMGSLGGLVALGAVAVILIYMRTGGD